MPQSRKRKKTKRGSPTHSRVPFDASSLDQKMSEVLLDFLAPYREEVRDDRAMESLVALGVVTWNIALLPPDQREASLESFCGQMFPPRGLCLLSRVRHWFQRVAGRSRENIMVTESQDVVAFKQVAHELIQRKLRFYAHNRRFITDFHLQVTHDRAHLTVLSTLPS